MPKPNLQAMFKNGVPTCSDYVDYATPEKLKELEQLKKKSETALKNKEVSLTKLSKFVIKK